MNQITLSKRTLTKRKARALLSEGIVPAVIYNAKNESTNVQVEHGIIERVLRTATKSTIFDLEIDGKTLKGVIKEVDYSPVNGILRHVSFYEIDPSQEMLFDLPIETTGVSLAVKNNLGILVQPAKTIQVKCKLADLVESIVVDISILQNTGDTILLRELEIPKGIKIPKDAHLNTPILTISDLQKAEEVVEAVVEGEEGEITDETAEGAVEGEEAESTEDTKGKK